MQKVRFSILFAFLLLPYGCAFDVIHVRQKPCQMSQDKSISQSFTLGKEVNVSLDTGYNRKLKKGTRWSYIGQIPEGNVFKTKDQVLTVEGSNIYEAYIVVSSGKLVGFYLPVEKSFSPIADSKDLEMLELEKPY